MEQYQNPSNCGSPNKYQSNNNVNGCGNSCESSDMQNDIGFDKSYGMNNTADSSSKRYMCRNCGTIHHGNSAPKNCCKCDCCDFKEM